MLNGRAARIPGSDAHNMALNQMFLFVRQQGIVMAFADVFLLLCLLFLVLAPLVWFMRRRPPANAEIGGY